ncbi:hypothetical protein J7U46_19995 [Pelomonas sp. V22]|uniref:hypothetical protein n=1 Tax=Pelomonas sp. V22 TaxID=2822139 RepID=UPI0024A9338E|nr:hypothetical protein [Pelomonas sp. V22]MDI4635356.1 hypothetical protein [Pelomonas sp. V22]
MRPRDLVSKGLLIAVLPLLQMPAAQAAEPVDEMLFFSVRTERNLLDVVGKGPWRKLNNADASGAVPGADWKAFLYYSAAFSDKFWPVKSGSEIAAGSAMRDGKESPFWLQTAPSSYRAMFGMFNSLVICPDPGEGASPDAKACLKAGTLDGVFPTKTRYKLEVALARLKEGADLQIAVIPADQRSAVLSSLEAAALQAKKAYEDQIASRQKREQEQGQRLKAKQEGLQREFESIPSGKALACDSGRAPIELGGSFSQTLVDCVLPSRYEIRMTVAEILAAGWAVESQSSAPSAAWGQRALTYSIVFRKR